MNILSTERIQQLKQLARKNAWSDDEEFMPDDYAGGNIDDAYWGGLDDGEIQLARIILSELGENWNE